MHFNTFQVYKKSFLNEIFGQYNTCCNVWQFDLRGDRQFKLKKLKVSFEHIHFCELENLVILNSTINPLLVM